MAKKNFDIDNLIPAAPAAEEKKPVVQKAHVEQVPAEQPKEQTQIKQASNIASNKAIKQESNTYCKSTKHTFPIPDDLWEDVETLLYALAKTGQKKKQNQLIIELLAREVEANKELIKSYK